MGVDKGGRNFEKNIKKNKRTRGEKEKKSWTTVRF